MVTFLRRVWKRHIKLGKGRKKKQVWRKPTGRDNKMRERRKGLPVIVSIGYKQSTKTRGLIKDKKPIIVRNIIELERAGKDKTIIIGNIGKKKKIDLIKKAEEMKIKIHNLTDKKIKKLKGKKNETGK